MLLDSAPIIEALENFFLEMVTRTEYTEHFSLGVARDAFVRG